jgi:ABC-type uncharacterized transport system auxiliary subunit
MKTLKMRLVLLGFLVAAAAACFTQAEARRYFDLRPEFASGGGPNFAKALLIERVDVDEVYDDFRIIYRLSATEINYYSYEFWAAKPDRMIRDAIDHYLAGRKAFRRIDLEVGREEPDWAMRCRVHRLEEVDDLTTWSARLAMDIEVREYKTSALLGRRSFDRTVPLARKEVAELPAALSRILAEEIDAFLQELAAVK